MASDQVLLIALFFTAVLLPAPWLGRYIYRVMEGETTFLSPVLTRVEQTCYRVTGIDPAQQSWKRYSVSVLAFTSMSVLLLLAILLLQGHLPLNPQHLPGLDFSLALNTAVSYVSNTNWQAYSAEASLSYFSQMLGLGVQNFLSPAVGLAVLVALCRGISRKCSATLGNFWVDLTRATLYVLLPLSLMLALLLVWQGVPQNLHAYISAHGLSGAEQTLPMGPAASQIAIKQLGTNGGGFFAANSAHPFENPTAWSNLFELTAILLLPVALLFTFGHYVKDLRQSRALLACMGLLFCLGLAGTLYAELQVNPAFSQLPVEQVGSLEGKEARFGTLASALWAVTTTAASSGSVNAMHDSFSALGGLLPTVNMLLGEVIFGGVGTGLYGMLLMVMLTVFLAGLMIGRSPEYLGKKLDANDVRLLVLSLLIMPVSVLLLTAFSASLDEAAAAVSHPSAHGFSQLLYNIASATANNGSAFAGMAANSTFYNLTLAAVMLLGRYGTIAVVLAIAGSFASKGQVPVGANSFPSHGPLFVGLLGLVIVLVAGLTFLPALALGPLAEHLSAYSAS